MQQIENFKAKNLSFKAREQDKGLQCFSVNWFLSSIILSVLVILKCHTPKSSTQNKQSARRGTIQTKKILSLLRELWIDHACLQAKIMYELN